VSENRHSQLGEIFQTTFGRSGHRARHWSLTLAARFLGQSAVSSASHAMTVPLPPWRSMTLCKG